MSCCRQQVVKGTNGVKDKCVLAVNGYLSHVFCTQTTGKSAIVGILEWIFDSRGSGIPFLHESCIHVVRPSGQHPLP